MAINHVGYFDFTYAGYAARSAGRLVRFMAKSEVFDHRVAGPLMRGMKHISVDRSAGAASFRRAIEVLRSGEIVGVFPEATISMSLRAQGVQERRRTDGRRRGGSAASPRSSGDRSGCGPRVAPSAWAATTCPILHRGGRADATSCPTQDRDGVTRDLRERMTALLEESAAVLSRSAGRPSMMRWWLPARLGGTAPTPERAKELEKAIRAEQVARYQAKAAAKAAGASARRCMCRRGRRRVVRPAPKFHAQTCIRNTHALG